MGRWLDTKVRDQKEQIILKLRDQNVPIKYIVAQVRMSRSQVEKVIYNTHAVAHKEN